MTTALIADDEPLLLDALNRELSNAWPELVIKTAVGDGKTAIECLLSEHHDVAFLDINMPGASGIEVMQAVIEEWPEGVVEKPPAIVFVSAHEEFALDAFELAAIDYILKPVTAKRLNKTIERLQKNHQDGNIDQMATQLARVLDVSVLDVKGKDTKQSTRLRSIPASVGSTVRLIPINDVVMFEASDKYVVVHTASQQALIREPLRNLLPKLDPDRFRQIHRSYIVNMDHVEAALKGDDGKMRLKFTTIDKQPIVSRVYRGLFQPL